MLSLFSSLHSIAARRGDGLRHELVALLKDQESNSKKRISTSPACELEMARQKVGTPLFTEPRGPKMSREQLNKAIVGRWFEGFWGNPWNPNIIDELAAPDVLLQYSLHAPRRGREDVRNFMMDFRAAFPDRLLASLIGANPSLFGCKNSLFRGVGNCPKKAAESLAFGPANPGP